MSGWPKPDEEADWHEVQRLELRQRYGLTEAEVDELVGLGMLGPEPRKDPIDAFLEAVAEFFRPFLEWLGRAAEQIGAAVAAMPPVQGRTTPREPKKVRRARERVVKQIRKAARQTRREEQRRNQGWTQ